MAANATEELLRQCEREPTSGSLLPLLDHAIEIKLPLKSVEYYTRIAMVIKSFFMCCADPQERAYVLETVLCWFEQHDEPFSTGERVDFPSLALLEDLCKQYTLDFPIGHIDMLKLWLMFIYVSPDPWSLFDAFEERITRNGYGPIMRHFSTQLPWPTRPYPCQVRARQDIVRMLRYGVMASLFVCHQGERHDHYMFARRILQRCLLESYKAAENVNPWREDHKDALFFCV
jgi:hypothetical protein